MVPPLVDDLPEDLFECGICKELLLDPTTLPCCGKSFCRDCLRELLISQADTGIARCPSGCNKVLPYRLPPPSHVLQRCLEAVMPEELERRKREAAESDAEAGAGRTLPGDFTAWEEVAASQDLTMADKTVVAFGTPGVVLQSRMEGRLQVLFDERVDFRLGSLDVRPFEVLKQLPAHFGVKIGQQVVASKDLYCDQTMLAARGTRGQAKRRHTEDRIVVQFEQRADGSSLPVNVHYTEVLPRRKLLGGYDIGQRAQASKDLYSNETLMVHSSTGGVVLCEFSDARLTVQFDSRADGQPWPVNVTLDELRPMTGELN